MPDGGQPFSMRIQQKGTSMTVVTLLALLVALAAVVTLLPRRASLKKCILGYKAVCSFAPISTALLLGIAGVVWLVGSLA
jgi:hypothetical protein